MTATSADLATEAYEQLAGALRGDLIGPADSRYDEARAVYNGMIDKHPAAIARCRDVADVDHLRPVRPRARHRDRGAGRRP